MQDNTSDIPALLVFVFAALSKENKPIRHVEGMVDAFDAALKRVKRN